MYHPIPFPIRGERLSRLDIWILPSCVCDSDIIKRQLVAFLSPKKQPKNPISLATNNSSKFMMTCLNKLEIKSLLLLLSPTNICLKKTIKLVQGSHITLDVYYLSFAASHSLPMSHAWHSLQLVHRVSPPPLDWIDNKCSKASSSARHSSQMQLQLQITHHNHGPPLPFLSSSSFTTFLRSGFSFPAPPPPPPFMLDFMSVIVILFIALLSPLCWGFAPTVVGWKERMPQS